MKVKTLDGSQFTVIDSAITVGGSNHTLQVTDTASKIPNTPRENRNTLAIQNFSTTDTIYIGTSSSVTAGRNIGSTTDGWEIGPLETWNDLVTEDVDIWAITDTGKTVLIKVLEKE